MNGFTSGTPGNTPRAEATSQTLPPGHLYDGSEQTVKCNRSIRLRPLTKSLQSSANGNQSNRIQASKPGASSSRKRACHGFDQTFRSDIKPRDGSGMEPYLRDSELLPQNWEDWQTDRALHGQGPGTWECWNLTMVNRALHLEKDRITRENVILKHKLGIFEPHGMSDHAA